MKTHVRAGIFRAMGFGLLMVASFVITGCGSGRSKISGTIEIDGKPVPSGDVTFIFKDDAHTECFGKITDGRYTVPDCPKADAVVTIDDGLAMIAPQGARNKEMDPGKGRKDKGPMLLNEATTTRQKEEQELKEKWKDVPKIPLVYKDPAKKLLPYSSSSGSEFNIKLESNKK